MISEEEHAVLEKYGPAYFNAFRLIKRWRNQGARKVAFERSDLAELPKEVDKLDLLSLSLVHTRINKNLNDRLKGQANLETLKLIGNSIGDNVSEGLKFLTRLNKLHLDYTKVGDELNQGLKHLTNLRVLTLSNTQVDDSLKVVIKYLPKLIWLDLNNTSISDALTEEFKHLKELEWLDIGSTQVKEVISLMKMVPTLGHLVTNETCFYDTPSEIHGFSRDFNSLPNIRAWISDLEIGTHKNRTFKLQICGNGTAGKTTITDRLLTGEYIDRSESTEGIQVRFSPPKEYAGGNDPIDFIIWDFAGQDIYHQMHRQFMRSESVVLLVYDEESITNSTQKDRKTGEYDLNRKLSYWAQDIMDAAPNSEVFLVQNKMDKPGARKLNVESSLPDNFRYHGPYYISAKDGGRAFNRLFEDIHELITDSKDYKMDIPQSWWEVRQDLLERTHDKSRSTMQLEEFFKLCHTHQLCANSETALLTYLDGLGVIIYDAERFPEQLVLNPQWALDGVYSALQRPNYENLNALDQETLRRLPFLQRFFNQVTTNKGQVTADQLPFDRTRYTEEQCDLFLKIMLRSGICVETNAKQNDQKVYLLFHLLPTSCPAEVGLTWNGCLNEDTPVLHQRYHNPHHLHRGVFRDLVRKLSNHVKLDHLWQDGLLLNYRDETYALVTTDYAANTLEINATGPHATAALQAFRNELSRIVYGDNNLRVEASTDGKVWFSIESLDVALNSDAKLAQDATGNFQPDWEPVVVWACNHNNDQTFKDLPEVDHTAIPTVSNPIPPVTIEAAPEDPNAVAAGIYETVELLKAEGVLHIEQLTLNLNPNITDNRDATIKNQLINPTMYGDTNFRN